MVSPNFGWKGWAEVGFSFIDTVSSARLYQDGERLLTRVGYFRFGHKPAS